MSLTTANGERVQLPCEEMDPASIYVTLWDGEANLLWADDWPEEWEASRRKSEGIKVWDLADDPEERDGIRDMWAKCIAFGTPAAYQQLVSGYLLAVTVRRIPEPFATKAKVIATARRIDGLELLTKRQREILELLGQRGLTGAELAEELGISLSTVTTHFQKMRETLGLTQPGLMAFAGRTSGGF